MAELEARDKIIEAMARAISRAGNCRDRFERCQTEGCECRRDAEAALAAIAEQGYAVVPRVVSDEMIEAAYEAASLDDQWHIEDELAWAKSYRAAIGAADLARPDPAREDKP